MFDLNSHILIVDDTLTMRKVIKKHLVELGYSRFVEAKDGKAAWEAIRRSLEFDPIHLVVCDWNMPVMSGMELLRQVRSFPATKKLPFVMITAVSVKDKVCEAIREDVSSYVLKPFTTEAFKEKLAVAYNKSFQLPLTK